MKKLMIASMLTAAALFTACEVSSESDSTEVGSCNINATVLGISTHTCAESENMSAIQADCNDAQAMFAPSTDDYGFDEPSLYSGTASYGSGCPSGAKKVCDFVEDGVSYTQYFYDAYAAEKTCDELLSDDEEDDYGFTPDDDEYYMKALKKAAKK